MSDWIINGSTLIKYTGDAERVVVPDEVKYIGSSAFREAPNMRELVISKNVTSLGGRSIYWCEKLERVDILSEKLNMDFHVFQYCTSLKTVNFNSCNTYIPVYCFSECKSLEEIILPEGVRGISDRAFSDCSNLKKMIILNPDITLGNSLFDGAHTDFEIEYIGDHNTFLKIARKKIYKAIESFGDYHHREVYEVEVTKQDYPFARFDQNVKTRVYCRADGVTLLFPSGEGKPEEK